MKILATGCATFLATLVLVGGLALRWILVHAGQASGWAADLAAR